MISRMFLATACAAAQLTLASHAFAEGPDRIAFSADTAYPESVTFSAKQDSFMVGSVRHGGVAKVARDGTFSPFITDPMLISTTGVLTDDQSNTIWVANADPGAGDRTTEATLGKLAAVGAYDATTGTRRAYYDLGAMTPGAHFANDMTLDDAGNLYVTDSFAPLIYKITPDGKATIFAQSPLFHDAEGFNLNGITWVEEGYLLVGKYNSGTIFRISAANPADVTTVKLPEALLGADGFHLMDATHLVVVQNMGVDRTVELVSTDGWASASIDHAEKSLMSMPTAAAEANGVVYVLNSRLDTLFNPKAEKVSDYLLQKF